MPECCVNHAPLCKLTGGPLRPGGLELTARALNQLNVPPGARILDAGCGNGSSLSLLSLRGFRPVGLDISTANLAMAREHGLPLVQAQAENLPLQDGSMDAVLCECVLSLMPRTEAVLKEFLRALKPEGILIASDVYARAFPVEASPKNSPPRCCLNGARSREEIESSLAEAGFSLVLWEDHSKLLAQLAGQIIFSFGSLHAFWDSLFPGQDCGGQICATATTAKPGYYLLIAIKGR